MSTCRGRGVVIVWFCRVGARVLTWKPRKPREAKGALRQAAATAHSSPQGLRQGWAWLGCVLRRRFSVRFRGSDIDVLAWLQTCAWCRARDSSPPQSRGSRVKIPPSEAHYWFCRRTGCGVCAAKRRYVEMVFSKNKSPSPVQCSAVAAGGHPARR